MHGHARGALQALKKCILEELGGNGWYFGSDGVRSPLHFMRNPGEPEYDGTPGDPGDGHPTEGK